VLPSFTRWDGAVFARLTRRLRAQVNVENLLDEHYYASSNGNNNITPGSPRAVHVSPTTQFQTQSFAPTSVVICDARRDGARVDNEIRSCRQRRRELRSNNADGRTDHNTRA